MVAREEYIRKNLSLRIDINERASASTDLTNMQTPQAKEQRFETLPRVIGEPSENCEIIWAQE